MYNLMKKFQLFLQIEIVGKASKTGSNFKKQLYAKKF